MTARELGTAAKLPFRVFSLRSAPVRSAVSDACPGAVPTAPPQNVQTEAVSSTSIRFLWNPPPQQFINGINQGYKVPGRSHPPTLRQVTGQGGSPAVAQSYPQPCSRDWFSRAGSLCTRAVSGEKGCPLPAPQGEACLPHPQRWCQPRLPGRTSPWRSSGPGRSKDGHSVPHLP